MKTLLVGIFWLGVAVGVLAHGRSPEMIRLLHAPVPEWMSLAEPIQVEAIDDSTLLEGHSFRPRSGGATNSRNRVQIPERGLEFPFDYSISWRGGSNEGYGVSLSPDGRRLLVNSGTTPHLYEINSTGDLQEIPIRLPHVTHDEGLKGFITRWSWAGDDVLMGHAEITDENGHEIIEGRLYVFYMKEQALARLDLSALNLPDTADIEVAGIGEDLAHLQIRLGDSVFAVKADLKSPPRLLAKLEQTPASNTQAIEQPPAQGVVAVASPKSTNDLATASNLRAIIWVSILVALGLLWLLLKRRS